MQQAELKQIFSYPFLLCLQCLKHSINVMSFICYRFHKHQIITLSVHIERDCHIAGHLRCKIIDLCYLNCIYINTDRTQCFSCRTEKGARFPQNQAPFLCLELYAKICRRSSNVSASSMFSTASSFPSLRATSASSSMWLRA